MFSSCVVSYFFFYNYKICLGYYKYCLGSTGCPSCVRQIYLNLFTRSVCLASIGKAQLDCKQHHFTQKFTAPGTVGSYDIRVMFSQCSKVSVLLAHLTVSPLSLEQRRSSESARVNVSLGSNPGVETIPYLLN